MRDVSLPSVYDPVSVESKWYNYWIDKRYFHADIDPSRKPYCITIPPPNVTGSLHIGHALCYSIQDVLVRWKRMQGFNALCIPGTDHAGIATQNKVEQQLAEENLSRHDVGRDAFIERVWAWKEKYGGQIIHQFKAMGFSFDWERERFTMDERYADAVLESFVRLFNKGYIYRGARVINWCPRCHTAISDIEVEHVEQQSHLWYLKYPLEDESGYVVVATTRPETMLGDTAVAVNPGDSRYGHIVGKNVRLPLTERLIPVIADEFVDMEFGTGAVKATPAHDPNDFEIGLRHNLPLIVVIDTKGCMTAEAGKRYEGLDRYDARKKVLTDIQDDGLLLRTEDYVHQVGTCERCHTVIEPLLSEQWFCRMKDLAKPAIEAVSDGRIKFIPERYEKTYLEWMENIRDWCVSRQLWWGHRIPVWECADCGGYTAAKTEIELCSKCGSKSVTQDPDVLDTWFSSALWPFAVLGWPKDTPELGYFYPTDVLVTAREIIYLWVARMIFSSLEYMESEIPFQDVYIYATVLNEEGRRMSKSLGTGVDPLDLIERFGADALRFSLIQHAGKNQDVRFSDKRVENVRNFGNKIWNASRFVLMNLDGFDASFRPEMSALKLEDRWILSRLNRVIDIVNVGFAGYDLDIASRALYEFIWSEFCDWYVEMAKPRLRGETEDRNVAQAVLYTTLETAIRLLHPIMPFITEEVWQALPHDGDSIMLAPFPEVDFTAFDTDSENRMALVMEVARAVRNARAEISVPPSKMVSVLVCANDESREIIESAHERVMSLARITKMLFVDTVPEASIDRYHSAHLPGVDLFIETAGLVDFGKELTRIDTELISIEKELARVNSKLGNERFISRAPAEIVAKEHRIAEELGAKKNKLLEKRSVLTS